MLIRDCLKSWLVGGETVGKGGAGDKRTLLIDEGVEVTLPGLGIPLGLSKDCGLVETEALGTAEPG